MDGRPSSRYKCLEQGGLFGPRPGAKTLKRPVASPSSPPAALRRPEPQREPLLARHRASPKVWRAHQEGGTKVWSRIITGAVARERKRIALGFVWFAGVGSIRSISVNTCRSIQQAQFWKVVKAIRNRVLWNFTVYCHETLLGKTFNRWVLILNTIL